VERTLRAAFGKLGGILPPGSTQVSQPGADIHYAATIPMRATPGDPALPSLDPSCALHGFEGMYVVDGACLSEVTAKNCTLTIMANADRVGRIIAREWR
jgi:choline dehydrogenase-like flavoprotein